MKPYKGRLTNWSFTDEMGGFYTDRPYIRCQFLDHPYFAGKAGHTSWVEKYDPQTGEVETRNSMYRLVGPGKLPKSLADITDTVDVEFPREQS